MKLVIENHHNTKLLNSKGEDILTELCVQEMDIQLRVGQLPTVHMVCNITELSIDIEDNRATINYIDSRLNDRQRAAIKQAIKDNK